MKAGQKSWTWDELILAIDLYCNFPFGKMHRLNPDVIELASVLGRTPSAVAYKLGDLASLDPSLKARGIRVPTIGEAWMKKSGKGLSIIGVTYL